MAFTRCSLVVVLVAVLALYCAQSAIISDQEYRSTRTNLILGSLSTSDVLLFRTNGTRAAKPNQRVTQDLIYRGPVNRNITYIAVMEQGRTQNATAALISGGIRQNNATVRLTSALSRGYNYTMVIYGR